MRELQGWKQYWKPEPGAAVTGKIVLAFWEPELRAERFVIENGDGDRFALPIHSDLINKLRELRAVTAGERRDVTVRIERLKPEQDERWPRYSVQYEIAGAVENES